MTEKVVKNSKNKFHCYEIKFQRNAHMMFENFGMFIDKDAYYEIL